MKKRVNFAIVLCLIVLLIPGAVFARQESDFLTLGLTRNFGYGGLGKIQGNFTLKVIDPPDGMVDVSFYVDGELVGTVSAAPYHYKFHTSEFDDGDHRMSAVGKMENGSELDSNVISKNFLSSDAAWGETQRIIVPLLIGVGALTLLGLGLPLALGRNKEFIAGKYGPAGGAVCPRCGLPFSRSYLAPNMMVGKLVRCPHCGKFSVLARASAASLQEAEKRYAGETSPSSNHTEGEGIQKMLDDSRFED